MGLFTGLKSRSNNPNPESGNNTNDVPPLAHRQRHQLFYLGHAHGDRHPQHLRLSALRLASQPELSPNAVPASVTGPGHAPTPIVSTVDGLRSPLHRGQRPSELGSGRRGSDLGPGEVGQV
ncbi:hypothetical protein BT69DRAFT_1333755 [Atractiella rhizophila]|nr:hypothetical protein BT69DRAFT_1333755 [Atractiella rhizophila]